MSYTVTITSFNKEPRSLMKNVFLTELCLFNLTYKSYRSFSSFCLKYFLILERNSMNLSKKCYIKIHFQSQENDG